MKTLNSDMPNGHKRLSCLDFVKLPNHTQFLLLKQNKLLDFLKELEDYKKVFYLLPSVAA